ncbi:interferon gamma 1 [Polypterus senegalus]|uniref:interferon gamma 1 n=1 Tax=Polypterus senegalus TaxID=55291 RepID=UPI0019655F95|nr:interferon gamma 1 [Polypterus senegalus]
MTSLQLWLFFGVICLFKLGSTFSLERISPSVKNDIRNLNNYYKTDDPSLFQDGALFLNYLTQPESLESEEKVLFKETVRVYIDILKVMMNSTTGQQQIQDSLQNLSNELESLLKSLNGETHLKENLQKLWKIETRDRMVQRKAVFELQQVLAKALNLQAKQNLKRRRRRQNTSRIQH